MGSGNDGSGANRTGAGTDGARRLLPEDRKDSAETKSVSAGISPGTGISPESSSSTVLLQRRASTIEGHKKSNLKHSLDLGGLRI